MVVRLPSSSEFSLEEEMRKAVESVFEAVRRHHEFYRFALPMIASENVTSLSVRKLLASDFSHRYAEGDVGRRFYQGCEFIDEVESLALELARRLFGAEHVNVKPTSGVNANIAAIFALTNVGDRIMALSVPDGGHISHSKFSAPSIRGLKVDYLPFNAEEMNIDVERMRQEIEEKKPRMIILGASLFLFPHPVREAVEAISETDANASVLYDGSHVLGLIAGKQFQDPLREGADVLVSSTHKTFPGPQGAILLWNNDELSERLENAVFPGTVSNHHLHHVAGLAVALAEMLAFGEAYASQTVKNAKALARKLHEEGFDVLCKHKGFTASHQVAVDVSSLGGGSKIASLLESAHIIVNKNMLPWDKSPENPSGIRIGVQELTRIGMKEREMAEIAVFMRRVAIDCEPPENVKRDVIEFRRDFQNVHFSFDDGDAYAFFDELKC